MGKLIYDLGNSYKHLHYPTFNSTLLFHFIKSPYPSIRPFPIIPLSYLKDTQMFISKVLSQLHNNQMERSDAHIIEREIRNACSIILWGLKRAEYIYTGTFKLSENVKSLIVHLRDILGEHEELWNYRNRPGGLSESTKILRDRLIECEKVIET